MNKIIKNILGYKYEKPKIFNKNKNSLKTKEY